MVGPLPIIAKLTVPHNFSHRWNRLVRIYDSERGNDVSKGATLG